MSAGDDKKVCFMGHGNFKLCPVCMRERQTTTGRKITMKKHNRWDAGKREMVACEGTGRVPSALPVR